MPSNLDQKTRRALTASLEYYRELGITDFYRREPRDLPRPAQGR